MLLMIPGPTNVPTRITEAMARPMISHRGAEFHELYERILKNLKYAFQTKNDVFPITCSGTGGVECAVCNTVSKGDKFVIPTYGGFSERMMEDIVRFGGIPIEIPVEWGSACTADDVKRVLDSDKGIKGIAIVYNETSTGVTNRELPKIGKLAKDYDKLLIVDAISILAGDYLPVDEWNIDICVAGSQKCLACPPGLAAVSVSSKAYEAAERNKNRPFYYDLVSHREFVKKLETPFTPAVNLYFALDEALLMLMEEGLDNRIKRHKTCAEAFYTAFEQMELKTLAKKELRSNTLIAVYEPENIEDKVFRDTLRKEHGITIGGGMGKLKGKLFRLGSMGIVSSREVLKTVDAIGKVLRKLNYEMNSKHEDIISGIEKMFPNSK
ncbi:MAG: alanine--glyoxylate aminotransferase family protein [Candidatus Bathyarchaeota archaeon]